MKKREKKMNFVTAIGGNKTQRKIAETTVHQMIAELLPKFRTLDIEVHLKKLSNEAVGYCTMTDNNRTFEIEVDRKLNISELVTTICHEMVHVKQYARNEMNDGIIKGRARWKNRYIPEDTNYWDLPWEKEAYRMEKKLADDVWENGVI